MIKRLPVTCTAPLLGALMLASSGAIASGLSYSYGELRYVDLESNVFTEEADGFQLGGSYRIDQQYFVFGQYADLDTDFGPVDGDLSQLKIGGGYIYPLNDRVDINSTLALVREDIDVDGVGDDDDIGFQITGGARTMLTNEIEVRGAFVFADVLDRNVYLEVAADYYFTDNLVAGITIEFAGDNDVLTFGGRYYFGR